MFVGTIKLIVSSTTLSLLLMTRNKMDTSALTWTTCAEIELLVYKHLPPKPSVSVPMDMKHPTIPKEDSSVPISTNASLVVAVLMRSVWTTFRLRSSPANAPME